MKQIQFIPSGRGKARNPSNPHFPDGMIFDGTRPGDPTCTIDLPYPAPETGHFDILCEECGLTMLISCAGRADDPKRVIVPCLKKEPQL